MKALVQRVSQAKVSVEGSVAGEIGRGLLVMAGFRGEDTPEELDWMVEKITGLRIFPDQDQKMNLSVRNISGEILVVSQFTLHADTRKGKRPSYIKAADSDTANILYRLFIQKIKDRQFPVAEGVFGAHMFVELTNDGPVTIMIDSPLENMKSLSGASV
ncbi:MAG: D-aminoacyl-tRNA deacylase [Candidatus Fermentibacteria bacterium]|nr:D-aminoacyl-tRNA deacylase [Candidatus Fermentibacteria bacterium]